MVLSAARALRRRTLGRTRDERGAFLIIAALLLVAMLTVTAIAVDLANARQQKRQAQATADAAALAAAQDLPDPVKVVATAKAYALQNFDVPGSAWIGCKDPEHLANMADLSNSNQCISIDEAFSRVRVVVPDKAVKTYFAGVIGVDSVAVAADAIAEAKLKRDDRIIPATVAAASGSGNLCIENGGNNVGCASRTSGNFGSFDARRVSLFKPTSNAQQDSLRINYSMGIDHALAIYGTGTPKVCDVNLQSPCTTTNVSSTLEANHLVPFTGNNVPPLTDGVIDNATISTDDGDLLFCGRLKRPDLTDENLTQTDPEGCTHWADSPGPGPSITVLGDKINGRHAYTWMKPAYQTLFFPGASSSTPSTSSTWATGDAKLACFMKTYRFDYGGSYSQGHAAQTEFFIDPTKPIDPSTGVGTEFTLAQAKTYLTTTCGLDATTVDAKLASLTDAATFWPMFNNGMVTDPRFGMIPVVKNFGSGGSTAMQLVRFWSIYMYRLYPNNGNTKLDAIDAWVFEPALIQTPSGIADLQFGYQTARPIVRLVH
ncbi:pilus assembly protein TadG-related protein [Dermatobacter hominis]|uniref:pilus assembly protein TadG-related protein n=1 Tax=Dermatobacter hominis TaxID=2884263 RepID=UPI001D1181C7|nr:pilus assembly protein TadG-related protein [Dermatobacter hominis]UDY35130.1 pilus assembly protein TadG-related protein [Dermatobacter hominis]